MSEESNKVLWVQFDDGSGWDIPAEIVAAARARYFALKEGDKDGKTYQEVYDEEYAISMQDDELLDWAKNNMNWEDVSDKAEMIQEPPPYDYTKGWSNAEIDVVKK